MSLTIEKNHGIRLRLAGAAPASLHQGREAGGYYKVRSYHGGGEFFQQENAQLILQCLGEFLPRASERPVANGGGVEILFQHLVNGQDVCGTTTSLDTGADVPQSEIRRLEDAIAKLKAKEIDPGTDPTKREIIRAFRLPDPRKDPELWRIYRSNGQARLIVLWGVEKEAGTSLAPQDALAQVPRRKGGMPWWVWLLLVLLLLAFLGWWLSGKRSGDTISATPTGSGLPVSAGNDQLVSAPSTNEPTLSVHPAPDRPSSSPPSQTATPAPGTAPPPGGSALAAIAPGDAKAGSSGEKVGMSPAPAKAVPSAPTKTSANTTAIPPSAPLSPSRPGGAEQPKPRPAAPSSAREAPQTAPSPAPASPASPDPAGKPRTGDGDKAPLSPNTGPSAPPPAMLADSKSPASSQPPSPIGQPSSPTLTSRRGNQLPGAPEPAPTASSDTAAKKALPPSSSVATPSPSAPSTSTSPPLSAEIVNARTSATPKDGKVEMQLSLLARDADGKAIIIPQIKEWSVDGKPQIDVDGKPVTTAALPVNLPEGKHRVSVQGIAADGRRVSAEAEVNVDIAIRQESTVRVKQVEH